MQGFALRLRAFLFLFSHSAHPTRRAGAVETTPSQTYVSRSLKNRQVGLPAPGFLAPPTRQPALGPQGEAGVCLPNAGKAVGPRRPIRSGRNNSRRTQTKKRPTSNASGGTGLTRERAARSRAHARFPAGSERPTSRPSRPIGPATFWLWRALVGGRHRGWRLGGNKKLRSPQAAGAACVAPAATTSNHV